MNVFVKVLLNQLFCCNRAKSNSMKKPSTYFHFSLWVRLHYTPKKINILTKPSSIFFLHDSQRMQVWGFATETRSNDILLAGESELTYFTVGESLRLQMKQKKCFSILSHTKSFPFCIALIERVVNDISPGQLLNMVCFTCKHTKRKCMQLSGPSQLFLSHSHLCPFIFWSKSNYFRWH